MPFSKSRLLVSVLALVSAASAIAGPKVGDYATMSGALVSDDLNAKVSTTQEITAYNSNTGVYTVRQTQTIGPDSQSKEVQVVADDLMTEENGAAIATYCESQAIGKKDRITVTAGTYDTCRVTNSNGSILWIAGVPFGVVKLQTKISGGTITLGAAAFSRGR